YLVDEVIMVGDQNFQRKCYVELFEKRSDRALIFASHSEHFIRDFCDRALILENGVATAYDSLEESIAVYNGL
ncbi:ABC transporter ATP-binding protein, partial [Acinetobacter baumannii]